MTAAVAPGATLASLSPFVRGGRTPLPGARVQTIERPSAPSSPPPPNRRADLLWIVLGLLAVPVVAFLVLSRWGVAAAVFVAFLAGIGVFVIRKQVLFIEVVAFCIHFDGIGLGPIRAGRVLAAVAFVVLLWKLLAERWRPPAVPALYWMPPMALLILAVASGAWSAEVPSWMFQMGLLGLAFAMWASTALLVDSHANVMRYLRAYWIGGLIGGANGVVSVFIGGRSDGFGGDPNFFGLLQASLIPLTIYYRRNARTPGERLMYSGVLVYVMLAAAGAGSRSGAIGAALALMVSMLTKPGLTPGRRVRTAAVALLAGGALFFGLFFVNPVNAARGLNDRGAGRLDFWTVTIELIKEQPLSGFGFGQVRVLIPERLASTPGVLKLDEKRTEVSAHNTFLDIAGDLGVVGLVAWVAVFAVTLYGFLRPRWPQYRDASVTMAVMMTPIFSGMLLLPLLNNKLSWSLIGLAAALHVPSRQARWRGYHQAASTSPGTALDVVSRAPVPVRAAGRGRLAQIHPLDPSTWTSPPLARFDLRVSQRYRRLVVAGALVGGFVFGSVGGALPPQYVATAYIVVPGLEESSGAERIDVSSDQAQGIHALVNSGAYAQALKELAGLDLSIPEIEERVDVTRPDFSVFLEITFTDSDRAVDEQVLPYLIPALDQVVADARRQSVDQVADEFRPVEPGQRRFYTGPIYVPVSDQAFVELVPRPVVWIAIVGAATGSLVAATFVLLQQRRPRVNNDDDLGREVGVGVWAHVARLGRRFSASPDQLAQVAASAADRTPVPVATDPAGVVAPPVRRFVVTTPRPDRAARGLAAGLAATLAGQGQRVVLVDAQIDSPLLSLRLAQGRRPGLAQLVDGSATMPQVIRRVLRPTLPSAVRRALGRDGDRLRFIPSGVSRPRTDLVLSPAVLDELGDDVVVVVLAPALLSGAPVSPWLSWADATLLTVVEGRTVTFDVEDAAGELRALAAPPYGVVMLDV